MRPRLPLLLQTAFLLFAALSLLAGFRYFVRPLNVGRTNTASATVTLTASSSPPESQTNPPPKEGGPVLKDGDPTFLEASPSYIKAIMTPGDHSFPKMECPAPSGSRYDYLRDNTASASSDPPVLPKYFFALNLHQCMSILPRLMGSIVESIRFLGPQNCALSVVEGRSDDGTFEVLKSLREEIEKMGAKYFFDSSELDPMKVGGHRIKVLAELRNQALQPLVDHPDRYSPDATVIFINDVAICMEDVLELVHQRLYQNADMTCAMDWNYLDGIADPYFYDVWIARDMNGDSFFDIPLSGSWENAWSLFANHTQPREKFEAGEPFQVFSCWNGAVAFTAKPLLDQKIKFRAPDENECPAGEPKTFCKDMWYHGYRKIAVIPAVNLVYTNEAAAKIKSVKGYVSTFVQREGDSTLKIEWEIKPPALVRCIRTWESQSWLPWDDHLGERG